jgi:hypothetical protein
LAKAAPIIANHNYTDIAQIPENEITQAKSNLHNAYGHTSHGSQLTTGIIGLVPFMNGLGPPQTSTILTATARAAPWICGIPHSAVPAI